MSKKVCVAMSGGVDSSVAAAMLQQQGYEVVGAFMKNWSYAQEGVHYHPWEDEARDAEAVCRVLHIPFHIFDFESEYRKRVVDAFVREYRLGRTPNPDVLCNKEVKFDLFLTKAMELGADFIATGHYAQVRQVDNEMELVTGTDLTKDQSYFLYTLTGRELPHILFPIGHLLKREVRALAQQFNLPTAGKKDSQGICFIGPVSMRKFLQHYLRPEPGNVVNAEGRVIGHHEGVIFYTEGQRHGFDTGGSHVPLYVAEKRVDSNELLAVPLNHPALNTTSIALADVSWVGKILPLPSRLEARVRYRQALYKATLDNQSDRLVLDFDRPVQAVSIGQSAVLYLADKVLGGGIIAERLR